MHKRTCLIAASTAVLAVILGIVQALATQDFLVMASSLLVQFAWLMSVIIISTLLRVEVAKTLKTLYIYLPLLVNGFIVISFRVVLIPNILVNLIFPPVLLVCCLWQWHTLRKLKAAVGRSDRGYASFSQFVFVVSLFCSLIGYTLLSVRDTIWWIMQLTCILTSSAVRDGSVAYAVKSILNENQLQTLVEYMYLLGVCCASVGCVFRSA